MFIRCSTCDSLLLVQQHGIARCPGCRAALDLRFSTLSGSGDSGSGDSGSGDSVREPAKVRPATESRRRSPLGVLMLFAVALCLLLPVLWFTAGMNDDDAPEFAPASGVVLCNKQPLAGVWVVLMDTEQPQFVSLGQTNERGEFSLMSLPTFVPQGQVFVGVRGAVVGRHRVLVLPKLDLERLGQPVAANDPLSRLIPAACQSYQDTPLRAEVGRVAGLNEIRLHFRAPRT